MLDRSTLRNRCPSWSTGRFIFCIRDLQTGAIVPVAGDADPTALLHAGAVDNALDSRVAGTNLSSVIVYLEDRCGARAESNSTWRSAGRMGQAVALPLLAAC
jgi:hypothetical protein